MARTSEHSGQAGPAYHDDRGGCMTSKLLGLAVTLGLPTMLAAQTPQIPNEHASDRGKAMGAVHSQGAAHRATHRRGDVGAGPHTRDPHAAATAVRGPP